MWQCPKCDREFRNTNQQHRCGSAPTTIEDYIAAKPESARPFLTELHATISEALPDARTSISWSMPTYWGEREHLIQFAAYAKHASLFISDVAMAEFAPRLESFDRSQHGFKLPYTLPIPADLVAEIAAWRATNEGSSTSA